MLSLFVSLGLSLSLTVVCRSLYNPSQSEGMLGVCFLGQIHRAQHSGQGLFVCWLLNVPATCECISGTDLLRQFDVLPH